ncbi:MAG: Crp/Fnr family transcriptional regulator [Bacteroidota bacterium]
MPDDIEKRLAEIVQRLPAAQAQALLEFAEFLLQRHGGADAIGMPMSRTAEIPAPLDIPRPAEESVVKAVKRLRATYPMLDARKLLNETSDLMTQHVMQGREKTEVIEELEILFRVHYERLVGNNDKD